MVHKLFYIYVYVLNSIHSLILENAIVKNILVIEVNVESLNKNISA